MKKEHLNDRVENSVRWTVIRSKKGFSAENPPLLSLHGINDAVNQIIHFRFIIIIQGTDHGYFRIQNTHLLHLIIQEVLHEGTGFRCPGPVFNDSHRTLLHIECLHMHEEIMHNRIDSQVIGYRSQYDMAVFKRITDQVGLHGYWKHHAPQHF